MNGCNINRKGLSYTWKSNHILHSFGFVCVSRLYMIDCLNKRIMPSHWYIPFTIYDTTSCIGESMRGHPLRNVPVFFFFSICSCNRQAWYFQPAAPNDWVQGASPDVISSNVCRVDLSRTLQLAFCCHADRLMSLDLYTNNNKEAPFRIEHSSIPAAQTSGTLTEGFADKLAALSLDLWVRQKIFPSLAEIFKCTFLSRRLTKWIKNADPATELVTH